VIRGADIDSDGSVNSGAGQIKVSWMTQLNRVSGDWSTEKYPRSSESNRLWKPNTTLQSVIGRENGRPYMEFHPPVLPKASKCSIKIVTSDFQQMAILRDTDIGKGLEKQAQCLEVKEYTSGRLVLDIPKRGCRADVDEHMYNDRVKLFPS